MPKFNDLNALFRVPGGELNNSDYYLFMLGTDTVFTPKPTRHSKDPVAQKTYENGETLSFMAKLIASILDEGEPEIRNDQPLAFSTPSVDVVIGPKTKGTEVGERIAQGVFLVLKAVAEGKKNIQIAAHSRGAVESILIAHELERIKKALASNPDSTLYQILLKSPCSYTRNAVQGFFKEANESKEARSELLHRLSDATLNMFLMDPVPGGGWNGINLFAWEDERFYPAVPCNKAELLLFRDERTKCFMPIKPRGLVPLVIPGHHGTASGNLYSQQFTPVPETITYKDTALVQELVLVKLLNFINNSTGLFNSNHKKAELEHPVLDKLTNDYLQLSKKERADFLLYFYKEVHRNDEAYRFFSTTSYAYLGRQASSSGARLVHADGPNETSLDTLSPSLGGQFINKEHAFLYLLKHMGFKLDGDEYQPHELIPELSRVLISIFEGYKNPSSSDSFDMSQSIGQRAVALLEADQDRKATFEAISLFLDTISQKYLRNHLSVEIKTRLLSDIHSLFDVLQQFKDKEFPDAPINEIINECDIILRTSLKDTVQKHYETLLDQTSRLNEKIAYFLTPIEGFHDTVHTFLSALDSSATEENERSDLIRTVSECLRQINPITIDGIKKALAGQLVELKANTNVALASDVISLIIKLTSGAPMNLEGFFEILDWDESMLLSELDGLYDNLDSLINGFAHVQQLSGAIQLDIKLNDLLMYRSRIVRMAAEIFVKKQSDFHHKPSVISDEFFDVVRRQAIALGAPNPEVNDLLGEVDHLKALAAENSTKIRQLQISQQEQLAALATELAQSKQACAEEFSKIQKRQQEINDDLTAEKQQLNDRLTMQEQLIQKLTSPTEMECSRLIETKLKPLTQAYLEHLIQAAGAFNPIVDNKQAYDTLPDFVGDDLDAEQYLMIMEKYSITKNLLNQLEDKQSTPLPSDRVLQFTRALHKDHDQLKKHRDSEWMQYFKGCMIVIGIVCTGIIPGLAVLLAYTSYKGKSSPMFFNNTAGGEFALAAEASLVKANETHKNSR